MKKKEERNTTDKHIEANYNEISCTTYVRNKENKK